MSNKATQTLIPTNTIAWFFSPDHVFGGLFNLIWCLAFQHKAAGFAYIVFMFLSMIYKVGYLKAFCLSYVAGMLLEVFFS